MPAASRASAFITSTTKQMLSPDAGCQSTSSRQADLMRECFIHSEALGLREEEAPVCGGGREGTAGLDCCIPFCAPCFSGSPTCRTQQS